MSNEVTRREVTVCDLVFASLKNGCLGFGGPAGQIALMHRIFVDEKKWIDERRYLHALNYCMLLPGPEAQQLATYVGWLLRGVVGGLIAGLFFILPGALLIAALAALYIVYGTAPAAAGLLFGIKAAVIGFLVEALLKVGKRALKGPIEAWIALAAFTALAAFNAPFPLVIIAAGLLGLMRRGEAPDRSAPEAASPPLRNTLRTIALWGAIWLAPLILVTLVLGGDHVLAQIGMFFSGLSLVTFGGAYATLAYLQQQAVETYGWLTYAQMIDALGLAETTPGPLVLVNQFVGHLAAAGLGSFWLGFAGAAMASWCTFAPSFLWIFAGAPYAENLLRNRFLAGALGAVTPAVLGVIAALAVSFSGAVLFARTTLLTLPGGGSVRFVEPASLDLTALLIAVASAFALIRFKANAALVVVAAAAAGWALA